MGGLLEKKLWISSEKCLRWPLLSQVIITLTFICEWWSNATTLEDKGKMSSSEVSKSLVYCCDITCPIGSLSPKTLKSKKKKKKTVWWLMECVTAGDPDAAGTTNCHFNTEVNDQLSKLSLCLYLLLEALFLSHTSASFLFILLILCSSPSFLIGYTQCLHLLQSKSPGHIPSNA